MKKIEEQVSKGRTPLLGGAGKEMDVIQSDSSPLSSPERKQGIMADVIEQPKLPWTGERYVPGVIGDIARAFASLLPRPRTGVRKGCARYRMRRGIWFRAVS